MKKLRPILMQPEMVQAVIAGRKTMTRRLSGLKAINKSPYDWKLKGDFAVDHKGRLTVLFENKYSGEKVRCACPYGKVGDVLWVRENIWEHGYYYTGQFDETGEYETRWIPREKISYVATDEKPEKCRTKPSIHMPFTAARIFLEITSIKVERLQDITDEDAIAEGIQRITEGVSDYAYKSYVVKERLLPLCPYASFRTLWQSIHGLESWEVNPWLFAIGFKILSTTGKPESTHIIF